MFEKIRKVILLSLSLIMLLNLSPIKSLGDVAKPYDIVIKGGTIYNPSTDHELENYNIGIIGSKIKRITKDPLTGVEEIDAKGMVISPGFVDLISYDPNYIGIELKVLDGVTSNLAMHGGTEDADSWYRAWGNNSVLTNFGASSFVTRQRWPIIGYGVDAEMNNKADIDALVASVRKNVEAGALGISFSLEYVPGIKDELVPLLNLANEYNLPTFYHLRYSDEEQGLEGIQEVIDLGKETGAIIHVMHVNSTGGTFVMDKALDMISSAKDHGLDITSCFYPYDYWATYIDSARFRPGWQDRFKITYEDLQVGGTDIRITKDTFDDYRNKHLLVAAHGSMPESELIMLLKDPDTMIGSDTIIEPDYNNHPRGAGAYSRVFGKYVREEKILSTMDAIKKVSYFPAIRMESSAPSMRYKGRIEVGSDADITIFNPDTIIDKSTVKDSGAPSIGVEYVIINGQIVKNLDGIVKGVHPGKPIKSYFADQTIHNEPIEFMLRSNDGIDLSIDHIYEIDNIIYFPVREVFKEFNIPIDISKDGLIDINKIVQLTLGSKDAHLRGESLKLTQEPIIYNSDVYLSLDDLSLILKEDYEISKSDNLLDLKSLPKKDKAKDIISNSSNNEDEFKEKDNNSSFNTYFFIVGLLALFFLYLNKKNH